MSAPWLLDHAPYTPFMEPRTARAPGLMPLPEGGLITADPDLAAQMVERERLLAAVPDVVLALLPEGREAADELLAMTVAEAPAGFALSGGLWHRPDGCAVPFDPAEPLAMLGRMVAEDFCLLLPDAASGEYRLVGAVLCFPSRWSLAEKLGHPLTVIHDPVPDYDAVLARRVNRVFEALRPERPVWRVNWLVHGTDALHLPMRTGDKGAGPASVPRTLYLRTERQTLTRLPRSGAVAFGIKTSVCPLSTLTPAQAAALAREMTALDADTIAYRAGSNLHGAALAVLAEIAGQGQAVAASSGELNGCSQTGDRS